MSRRRGNVETTVFVTVGTTSFDDLITEVNKPLFHAALWCIGYRQLVIQFGDGIVEPESPSFESVRDAARYSKMFVDANVKPLSIDSFRFKSDLDLEFSSSSLVISHGGAGTCLRALTPGGLRRLIVVINETLMGNHQEELAEALAEGRHAIVTTPSKLLTLLCDEPGGCKFPGKLSSSKISELLRPQVRPADAGFTSFQRGSPERLLEYLETRLKT
ncbi:Beta-1 4-N-acetylglucosaminyltransferase [Fasciola gigantica]|uniref:UDP-N-acetylglucosamine transferase subunit ALG13 n=1 Tax=Fasciola gigantica TaxID=46835 RepID=A0A504XJX9_FASGI|nr:Beta-1 4-N-acetylglucosaminyltransferase [Fasciola gigantica]